MSKTNKSQKLLDNIVNYWNTAGLCSLDSSTSMKDEHIAIFENYIESRLLSEILAKYCFGSLKIDPPGSPNSDPP